MTDSNKINVLDHGFVRLIDSMGSDISISRAARVSYDAAWRAGKDSGSDSRLIHYLWENHHTTPFESVTFTFEVKAPIFVLRQWMRHRAWTYNELSARYKELPEECYLPDSAKIGTQSKSSKQARDLSGPCLEELSESRNQIVLAHRVMNQAFTAYKDLLAGGWPRELARTVLPLATYSHMFCTVNLLNLFKFISLRSHEHAQYEIRVYAEALLDLIRPIAPEAVSAWESTQRS